MTSNRLFLLAFLGFLVVTGCAKDSGTPAGAGLPVPNGPTLPVVSGANVLEMTVNGAFCAPGSYPNKPCVSIKICSTGTNSCVTISDILVDTGSSGLRVFRSALNGVSLSQVTVTGQNLAECAQFGDGSTDWGPVQMGDVYLGSEPAANVPIQVIDPSFVGANTFCGSTASGMFVPPDSSPSEAGFNGILGVGLQVQDCGTDCLTSTQRQIYFACNGSTCGSALGPLPKLVTNPVAKLPVDNNGVVLELPSVVVGGQATASGYLILGVGTNSNNIPTGVRAYSVDTVQGTFNTTFNGQVLAGFTDSGSNSYFFPTGTTGLTDCGTINSNYSGLYCPPATETFSTIDTAISGSPATSISLLVGNFLSLLSSGNLVFTELGGTGSGFFDFGLPFYLGRNVYVGLNGANSSLGVGPYFGF